MIYKFIKCFLRSCSKTFYKFKKNFQIYKNLCIIKIFQTYKFKILSLQHFFSPFVFEKKSLHSKN